jgi:hypothetical protein
MHVDWELLLLALSTFLSTMTLMVNVGQLVVAFGR